MTSDALYAIRVERLSYGGLQILQVKIGRTNDVERTLRGYRRSHPDAEILDLWKPNADLDTPMCERGLHNLAEKYAYQRNREVFTFLQESYNEFSENASLLIKKTSGQQQKPKTTPATRGHETEQTGDVYVVQFVEDEGHSFEIRGDLQSKTMVDAANYLITNHDLMERIEIPWVPGRSKAVINDRDEWEGAVVAYQPLEDGYYIDTNVNSAGKQREIKRMAQICGIDVNFKGDW